MLQTVEDNKSLFMINGVIWVDIVREYQENTLIIQAQAQTHFFKAKQFDQ